LLRAYELARPARQSGARVVLLVFTDGRANVSLTGGTAQTRQALSRRIEDELRQVGRLLHKAGVTAFIVDTRQHFTAGDEGERLARTLGGRYVLLPQTAPTL
jgi:Mg-chelatase subunit ChlD